MAASNGFGVLYDAIVRSWKRTAAIAAIALVYLAAVFEIAARLEGSPPIALWSSEGLLFTGTAVLLLAIVDLDLSDRLSTANKANDALGHANATLEDQLKDFEATKKRKAELETELSSTVGRLATATNRVTDLEGSVSVLTIERDGLRSANTTLTSELADKTNRLADAAARIGTLEKQVLDLTGQLAGTREELVVTQSRERTAAARIAALDAAVSAVREDSSRKDVELQRERDSTERAGIIPTLDVTTGTSGFGILAPKTVYVRVRNAGRGDATSVELAAAVARRNEEAQLRPVAFWAAIPAGEWRQADVSNLGQLGRDRELRTRVSYQTAFGPGAPIELRFSFA